GLASAGFLGALDGVPLRRDLCRGKRVVSFEYVRVAADELLVDAVERLLDSEASGVVRDLGQEHALKQQVAYFFAQIVQVTALYRVHDLRRLLQHERGQGLEGLLTVPRAAIRPA